MPVQVIGDHKDNDVRLSTKFLEESSGTIILKGQGARIEVGPPLLAGNIFCTIDSGASISIGENCVLGTLAIHALAVGATVRIGKNVGFNGSVSIAAHEPSAVEVGDECLFAADCNVNSSDVHSIFDLKTGARINPPADIVIGRNVWLAARVLVMKGTRIGSDSVVGAASVVSGTFEPNSLVAGVPARCLRSGITWRR